MSVLKSHRWLGYVLRLGVSALLIAWMLGRAELSRVGDVLRAADAMFIAAAFASYFVGYMVSVARWRVLLAVQGIRPRFSYLYWSFMIGVFFNQLLPTTIGGDVARYQYTAAGGRGAALSAVLLDRVFGTVSLMIFAMAGLALVHGNEALPQGLLRPVAALLVVGLLILVFAFLLPGAASSLLRRAVLMLPRGGRGPFEKLLAAFAPFRGRHYVAFAALGWSLVLQCVVVGHYYLAGLALGIEVPLGAYVFIVPLATVVTALPISINGIGVREGILGYLLGLYGVDPSTSLVFAWVLYAMLLGQGLLGGVVFAWLKVWRRESVEAIARDESKP
jgi:glycosyltransferase 2 family protein